MRLAGVEIPDLEQFDSRCLDTLRTAISNILAKRRFEQHHLNVGDEIFPGGWMARIIEIKKDSLVIERTGKGGFGTYETKEILYKDLFRT